MFFLYYSIQRKLHAHTYMSLPVALRLALILDSDMMLKEKGKASAYPQRLWENKQLFGRRPLLLHLSGFPCHTVGVCCAYSASSFAASSSFANSVLSSSGSVSAPQLRRMELSICSAGMPMALRT